ncbi:MAG TPA: TetR/AcrR family transcriptional regulator [Dongiaceae bacterium]|jgi:AcrR family transcriptional regulator|nr:TetR/AcrR family transcriptional regulator [Dongiaceae bacterium]
MKRRAAPSRKTEESEAGADGKGPDGKGGETRERILKAAEDLLRRHGPAKTTVVDVARALEMSHANVYRHFASKAELQDAVADRWLKAISGPMEKIARGKGPHAKESASTRLEKWVLALAAAKQRKVLDDPELFATYHAVAIAARDVAEAHVAELRGQVAAIIRDGVARGEFKVADPDAAAMAVLNATTRFHHPHHVKESAGRIDQAQVRTMLKLVLAGLRSGAL